MINTDRKAQLRAGFVAARTKPQTGYTPQDMTLKSTFAAQTAVGRKMIAAIEKARTRGAN